MGLAMIGATTTSRAVGNRHDNGRHGCQVAFSPLKKTALTTIKAEAVRLGNNGTREGFKFAERLFRALPELKGV